MTVRFRMGRDSRWLRFQSSRHRHRCRFWNRSPQVHPFFFEAFEAVTFETVVFALRSVELEAFALGAPELVRTVSGLR